MRLFLDLTIGQYYPAASIVHKLDPRCKLILSVLIMLSLFASYSLTTIAVWGLVLILSVRLSKLPVSAIYRNVVPFFWLFIITIIFNGAFGYEENGPRISIWGFSLYLANIAFAIALCLRVVLFIAFSSLLTLTTSPLDITDAIEKLLKPFETIGFPVHEFALMVSLSIRFVPTILAEADRLQKAQVARGASFAGTLQQKAKALIPFVMPLFISAFHRAEELALAMESRCYGPAQKRTSFSQFNWAWQDSVALAGVLSLAVFLFLTNQFDGQL